MNANGPAYEPLAMSNSGSGEENLFTAARRPIRRSRKIRSRRLPGPEVEVTTKIRNRARWGVIGTFFTIIIIIWLIVLTWFVLILRSEDFVLRSDISSAVVGVQNVPLAVQACHTAAATLRTEQAALSDHLHSLNSSLATINAQLPKVLARLTSLEAHQQKLPLTPLPGLSQAVAALGAELRDLHASFNQLQDSQLHSNEVLKWLNASVSALNTSIDTLKPTTTPAPRIIQPENNSMLIALEKKMEVLNSSIAGRLKIVDSDMRHVLSELDHQAEEKANLSTRFTNLDADVKQLQTRIPPTSAFPSFSPDLEMKLKNLNELVLNLKQSYDQLSSQIAVIKSQLTNVSKSDVTST